jgi:sugar lactone lactonase YvrE
LATPALAQANYSTPYTFTTIAGTAGNTGGNDGTNGGAQFFSPKGIAVDTNGNLYVVDNNENTIRKVALVGTNWVVTTIAGTAGSAGSADGTNGAAQFNGPVGITVDSLGQLYVADYGYNTIRKVTPVGTNWVVSTIAGTAGSGGPADGTNGSAQFNNPSGITVDTNGNLYVADFYNSTIRKVAPVGTNWVVTTIAGQAQVYKSTDGTGTNALFYGPSSITIDGLGNLYVADTYNYTIRMLTPAGTNWVVTTIAGQVGTSGSLDGTNFAAQFNYSKGITADGAGNLYVADTSNNTIRKVAPVGTNWVVSTLAGVADSSNGGSTDGTGASALFSNPDGIAVDGAGNLYVGDTLNGTIRKGQNVAVLAVPNLTIGLTAPNSVVVSWPNLGSYTLQSNADLTTTNWVNYGGAVTPSNGTNSVTISPPVGNLFFRLTIQPEQIAAVPTLTIGFSALNSLVVSWPSLGSYTLQSSADLTTTNWVNYGGAVTTSNGTNSVTIPPPVGNLFFRLTP